MINELIDMRLLINTIYIGLTNRIERILRNPGATCFTISMDSNELVFEYSEDGESKEIRAKSLDTLIPLAEKALYMEEDKNG